MFRSHKKKNDLPKGHPKLFFQHPPKPMILIKAYVSKGQYNLV